MKIFERNQCVSLVFRWVMPFGLLCAASHSAFAAAKPKISNISPDSVQAGRSDFTLTVTGSKFDTNNDTSVVNWNGSPRSTIHDLSTQLRALIPASDVAVPGTAQVAVSNTDLQSHVETSDPVTFTINPASVPPLTITTAAALPDGLLNTAYSQNLAASGGTPPYTWGIQSGSLPAGLNLSSDGLLAGTPTSAGTFIMTVRVRDSAQPKASATTTFTLNINNPASPLTITTAAALPNGLLNTAYSQNLVASGGTPPYTWNLQSGSLPAGFNLSSDGLLAGTPTSAGTFIMTVRVRDSAQPKASATTTFTLNINNPVPAITRLSPSSAAGGGPGFTLTVRGSNFVSGSTVQWNGSDRPTTFGSDTRVTASIAASDIASGGTVSVTVNNPGPGGGPSNALNFAVSSPLTITTANSLPDGLVNSAYSNTLSASGGTQPYTWSVTSGPLPPGLSLGDSSGTLSGTLTSAGSFSFTVQVRDSAGATATKMLTLTVNNPVPAITGLDPSSTLAGGAGFTLTVNGSNFVSGATVRWNGSNRTTTFTNTTKLRASISASDINSTQIANVTVNNPSPGGGASNVLTFQVSSPGPPGPTPLAIITAQLPDGTLAAAYSQTLSASGGAPPYQWSISSGTPPTGLSLAPATGVLGGIPSKAGDFAFTVTVTDSTQPTPGTASKALRVRINNPPPVLTSLNPPSASSGGSAFTLTLTGTGFTPTSVVTWNNSDRPTTFISGVRLTALISASDIASPTLANVGVRSPSPGGGTSTPLVFVVSSASSAPTITTSSPLPDAFAGSQYSQTLLASGGNPPYTWSVSPGMPAGLALDSKTGVISGTATAPGTFQLTVHVSDTQSSSAKSFQLLINPRLPAVSISGATDVVTPAQQPVIELTLAQAYPLALSGQMTLTFTPDADEPSDDPTIQFATGGRAVSFTIAANSVQAQFPNSSSSVAFQTGTVSGTIKMSVSLQSEGNDITPTPAPNRSFKVNRAAPAITRLSINSKSTSGFEIEIIGFSTPRSLTQLVFTFTPRSGSSLGTTNLTLPLGTSSATWFQSQTSKDFGSLFRLTIPFTVQGDVNVLQSVAATLSNAEGSSDSVNTSF